MLFPPILRSFLLSAAQAGLYTPLWSDGVEAEWLHVARRKGEDSVPATLERMRLTWPDAMTGPGEPALLDLPDATDRHILAAAYAGGADLLLTLNLRDFPRRALAPLGLTAISPDDFAMQLWLDAPGEVERIVDGVWPDLSGRARRNAMKRATLPRLGRALETD
ncbi:PIN domain-containing protein [Rhodobacter sp. NTK016B]|nr:PIN domain-containing protein [Rhodobacter sp. NTK016B]